MTTPFPFVANTILNASQLNAITTLPIAAKTANYTLVVGDVGYRVQMTNASATTITVNTGIFAAGDTIWIQNLGAGTCTITAGTATVGTASSLALAQYGGGTLVFQSASAATFFSQQAATYGTATGGIGAPTAITVSSVNYSLLTFTASGTLTVTKSGLFDLYIVGAGASGACRSGTSIGGGGGGGGAVIQSTVYLDANQTVTIGAKGVGTSTSNTEGNRGTFSKVGNYAAGGGGGGLGGSVVRADNAGSGGGGLDTGTGTALISIGASNGGTGTFAASTAAGGGGGSSAVGGNAVTTTGGAGGAGVDASLFRAGSTLYIGSGGGGGSGTGTGGTAGNSTGGNGGSSAGAGSNATAGNYGCGGGGGGGNNNISGAGADGIVYVRFKS